MCVQVETGPVGGTISLTATELVGIEALDTKKKGHAEPCPYGNLTLWFTASEGLLAG